MRVMETSSISLKLVRDTFDSNLYLAAFAYHLLAGDGAVGT